MTPLLPRLKLEFKDVKVLCKTVAPHYNSDTMARILMIDLDDTLAKTDLLLEAWLTALKTSPRVAALFPVWILTQGKAAAKIRLATEVPLNPAVLPYRQALIDRIQSARREGTTVVLASASPEPWVKAVADHLGCFDRYRATQTADEGNFKSHKKVEWIESEYAQDSVTYAGDAHADLPIWKKTGSAILINPSATLKARAQSSLPASSSIEVIEDRPKGFAWLKVFAKALRVHQWAKNSLIFVPWILGHYFTDRDALLSSFIAFLAFSFVASTVYVVNDLLDLEADRKHHSKRNRPFAAGSLSVRWGFAAIPALLSGAALLTWALPSSWSYGWLLVAYGISNLAYSFRLKKVYVLDVVLLAGFYTLRIFAGGLATDIPMSPWLLSFSVFLFFGLALLKRFIELHKLSGTTTQVSGRGYQSVDLDSVFALGIGSSLIAGLILVLYLNSPNVVELYAFPERLWFITPVFLYWTSRIWMLAKRGELDDDPVSFAIQDKGTWYSLFAGALIFFAALGWSF
jgi:4-hydroxybenzoate polyprenyltransferase/phosphoserine phosphatase